jgi:hypothetical protein
MLPFVVDTILDLLDLCHDTGLVVGYCLEGGEHCSGLVGTIVGDEPSGRESAGSETSGDCDLALVILATMARCKTV